MRPFSIEKSAVSTINIRFVDIEKILKSQTALLYLGYAVAALGAFADSNPLRY